VNLISARPSNSAPSRARVEVRIGGVSGRRISGSRNELFIEIHAPPNQEETLPLTLCNTALLSFSGTFTEDRMEHQIFTALLFQEVRNGQAHQFRHTTLKAALLSQASELRLDF